MIVSASYKTDIPAFYGEWFINRLKAGYCCVRNPYGSGSFRVSLRPEDVDGIVFWTRNIGPFLPRLPEVRRRGIPFVVQYTINAYPRALDAAVPDAGRSIEHMKALHGEYGPRVAVWRYDTIVYSSITPPDFHLRNFERIARELAFPFPYVLDQSQEVAKAYGAVCTPDFFGYNDKLELQYRGRLDESRKDTAPETVRRDLFEAMRQVALSGQGPAQQLPGIGCSIKWRDGG